MPQLHHRVNNPHLQYISCTLSSCTTVLNSNSNSASQNQKSIFKSLKKTSGTSKPSSSFCTKMPHSSPKLAELSNIGVSQHERKYRLPAEIRSCAFTEEYITGVRKAHKYFSQQPFLASIENNLKMHWFTLTFKGISTSFMGVSVLG